jgi:hypothetical protein
MYCNILIGLGIVEFGIACRLFQSIFGDDKPRDIAPRPMFLANLLSMALQAIIAERIGAWLGFRITRDESAIIG